MRNVTVVLLGFIIASSIKGEIDAEISKAIQKNIKNYINKYLSSIKDKVPKAQVIKAHSFESTSYSRELTPEIVERALYNLKDVVPEIIPLIPFAVAEPTSSNILFYFGTLNSYFRNLTDFTCTASVNNTVSSSSIGVDLHLNSTSLNGNYELDVSSYDMHLYGDGEYSIVFNGTDTSFLTNINIHMDDSFLMTDFLSKINVSTGQLFMSNLLDGDPSGQKLIDVINDVIPSEVEALNDVIQQAVNSSIVDFTNSYFAKFMTWSDVLTFIYYLADM